MPRGAVSMWPPPMYEPFLAFASSRTPSAWEGVGRGVVSRSSPRSPSAWEGVWSLLVYLLRQQSAAGCPGGAGRTGPARVPRPGPQVYAPPAPAP